MAERTAMTLAPPSPDVRLDSSSRTSSHSRSRSPDVLSLLSNDDLPELRTISRPQTPVPVYPATPSSSSVPGNKIQPVKSEPSANDVQKSSPRKKSWRVRFWEIWDGNYGLMLVFLAQLFATLMNVTTGLLESKVDGGGMNPFQILFARMSITVVCSLVYMWYKSTPDWPLGAKEVRWLLVARGVGGFFGVFGLYWSLQYLPLSDATVITFLAPVLACYACSKFINEPFTRTELLGGIVSLIGVVLIARPTYLFENSKSSSDVPSPTDAANPAAPATAAASASASGIEPTPGQHLAAIGMAIVGVFGAASAYTTIRMIGHRAHPLISVTYFSFWCTLVSFIALTFVPSIPFVLPSTVYQWTLLFFIGISGFVMQFLLTAGLRAEKSGRATNMIYTQMIFALAAEKIIWGTSPGIWSWAGSLLIMGAAGAVAMQKSAGTATGKSVGQIANAASSSTARDEEEATGMLVHDAELHRLEDDDDSDIEMEEQVNRGRRLSIEDDEETLRPSTDQDHGSPDAEVSKKEISRASLDPDSNWKFPHRREGTRKAYSEEVSPHSPVVSRKPAVFWSK